MNMKHNPLWAAIALGLGMASGSALAAPISCTVTPTFSILTEGQTLQLQAVCDGALSAIDWQMDAVSVTGPVPLANHLANQPVYYTSPVGLGASTNPFTFTVTGTPASGQDNFASSTAAKVYVKPSSAVVAKASGSSNPTTPVDAQCGAANNTAVASMPSNGQQCASGSKPALPVSAPQSFSWSCVSLTGGAEASCYAVRGYTVTASAGASGAYGSVNPTSQAVASGASATVNASPNSGYSTSFSSTCGGSASGNSFTTAQVSSDCNVTATFTNQPVNGACGSASNVAAAVAPSTGLCSTGSASSVVANTSNYTWGCNGANSGTNASCQAPRQYAITATAGANGSISPASKNVTAGTNTTFTVTPSSGYAASVSGCGGSLSGSTYTTGSITSACTVSASFAQQTVATTDPGKGTGLWVPPNTTGRVIADRGGSSSLWVAYVPGCVNGQSTSSSTSGCAANAAYTGTVYGTSTTYPFAFGNNNTLGLRYTSNPNAGAALKYFKLSSGDGGNTGSLNVWLSDNPAATYDGTDTVCKSASTTHPIVATGPNYCPITPNKLYYLFISTDTVGNSNLRYQVTENTSDFQ